ncbi:MAG: DUF6421 family protein [Chthoniobacteraceae bacterium]
MKIAQRPIARVLFDEYHSESWSVSAERARAMQPADPANASYQAAADALAARDFVVARNVDSPLDRALLAKCDVLALLHPCDSKWERTTSQNSPLLSPEEIAAVRQFVERGGGLVVITENEHDKYGDNLNALLEPMGVQIENGVAFDRSACVGDNPEWVLGRPAAESLLAHRANAACFYRAGWVSVEGAARGAWQTSPQAHPAGAALIVTAPFGAGRVVVIADSNLFGDERFASFDLQQLWLNLIYWCAAPAFAKASSGEASSPAAASPHWAELKTAINQLRKLQSPDGSVVASEHAAAATLVEASLTALDSLRSHFTHQDVYLDHVADDFRVWSSGGFAKPDFGASLAAFHPEQQRRDGVEHLVLFPMYTPNASSDTRCEALLVRTPWPEWLAAIERTRFRNAKFVPGHLVDSTDGYASECAVLFPETVSLASQPSNHFGVIFCDREARRLQACARRAAEAVNLQLHPELECWLSSLPLIQDTTALWDLIHDRAHSLGELPFDPFMIRQRAPFWMYGLEELRVDLRSFGEAAQLAAEGFPFARYVCWAILLDRIFRFPITGTRVRNYDALGGQLLFSYLHQKDVLLWRDNRLTICWDALDAGVAGLREELTALYKLGADCSKMNFWLCAHDLVARYVRPNVASQWKADTRAVNDESDVKRWLDLVHPDEFPLGNFHLNLLRRLK